MMRVLVKNKTDLIFLILTKIIFAYSIYLFSTNFLLINFFSYPDMAAYSDCFGEGDIMVNVLYSQFFGTTKQLLIANKSYLISKLSMITLFIILNLYNT